MATYNDYRPEVRSLLREFLKEGFEIYRVDDGEANYLQNLTVPNVVALVCNVDEAHVSVRKRYPDQKEARAHLFLVLGNEPGVIVADYGVPEWCETMVSAIINDHADKWDGRKQPTVEEDDSLESLRRRCARSAAIRRKCSGVIEA